MSQSSPIDHDNTSDDVDTVPREAGLRTGAPDVLRAAASDTRRRHEHQTTPDVTPEHWVTD